MQIIILQCIPIKIIIKLKNKIIHSLEKNRLDTYIYIKRKKKTLKEKYHIPFFIKRFHKDVNKVYCGKDSSQKYTRSPGVHNSWAHPWQPLHWSQVSPLLLRLKRSQHTIHSASSCWRLGFSKNFLAALVFTVLTRAGDFNFFSFSLDTASSVNFAHKF